MNPDSLLPRQPSVRGGRPLVPSGPRFRQSTAPTALGGILQPQPHQNGQSSTQTSADANQIPQYTPRESASSSMRSEWIPSSRAADETKRDERSTTPVRSDTPPIVPQEVVRTPSPSPPLTPTPTKPSSSPPVVVKPIQTNFTPITPPPKLNFDIPPISWKGLPLEAAQWTLTSSELQDLVSRAIRSSARESFIRLLGATTLDETLPKELEALDNEKAMTQARYRFLVQRRTMLLQALNSAATAPGSDTSAAINRLTTQLADITTDTDRLTEQLVRISSHQAQITKLLDVHWASALAIALRKLNGSYVKRTRELVDARGKIGTLEAELEDSWKAAEKIAEELDELDEQEEHELVHDEEEQTAEEEPTAEEEAPFEPTIDEESNTSRASAITNTHIDTTNSTLSPTLSPLESTSRLSYYTEDEDYEEEEEAEIAVLQLAKVVSVPSSPRLGPTSITGIMAMGQVMNLNLDIPDTNTTSQDPVKPPRPTRRIPVPIPESLPLSPQNTNISPLSAQDPNTADSRSIKSARSNKSNKSNRSYRSYRSTNTTNTTNTNNTGYNSGPSRASQISAARRRSLRTSLGSLRLRSTTRVNIDSDIVEGTSPPVPNLPRAYREPAPPSSYGADNGRGSEGRPSSWQPLNVKEPRRVVSRRPVSVGVRSPGVDAPPQDSYPINPQESVRTPTQQSHHASSNGDQNQREDSPEPAEKEDRPPASLDTISVVPDPTTPRAAGFGLSGRLDDLGVFGAQHNPPPTRQIPSIWKYADTSAPKTSAERVEALMLSNPHPLSHSYSSSSHARPRPHSQSISSHLSSVSAPAPELSDSFPSASSFPTSSSSLSAVGGPGPSVVGGVKNSYSKLKTLTKRYSLPFGNFGPGGVGIKRAASTRKG